MLGPCCHWLCRRSAFASAILFSVCAAVQAGEPTAPITDAEQYLATGNFTTTETELKTAVPPSLFSSFSKIPVGIWMASRPNILFSLKGGAGRPFCNSSGTHPRFTLFSEMAL